MTLVNDREVADAAFHFSVLGNGRVCIPHIRSSECVGDLKVRETHLDLDAAVPGGVEYYTGDDELLRLFYTCRACAALPTNAMLQKRAY